MSVLRVHATITGMNTSMSRLASLSSIRTKSTFMVASLRAATSSHDVLALRLSVVLFVLVRFRLQLVQPEQIVPVVDDPAVVQLVAHRVELPPHGHRCPVHDEPHPRAVQLEVL